VASDPRSRSGTARGLQIGVGLALVAMVTQTLAHVGNHLLLDRRYAALDATGDASPFARFALAAAICAALAAAVAAVLSARRRVPLATLAVLIGLLAVDDYAGGHERLEGLVSTGGGLPVRLDGRVLVVGYGLLLAGTVLLLASAARRAAPRVRAALAAGVLLLALSVAIRLLGAAVELSGGQFADGTGLAARTAMQDGKLGGWILVAAALSTIARARGPERATRR
jgi:hypothetical protein